MLVLERHRFPLLHRPLPCRGCVLDLHAYLEGSWLPSHCLCPCRAPARAPCRALWPHGRRYAARPPPFLRLAVHPFQPSISRPCYGETATNSQERKARRPRGPLKVKGNGRRLLPACTADSLKIRLCATTKASKTDDSVGARSVFFAAPDGSPASNQGASGVPRGPVEID